MAPKRLITAAILLAFGLHLASCGSFVADHWPHWAGGLPADAPPRPGTPGYAEFIAHGQPVPETKTDAAKTDTATTDAATTASVQTGAEQAPPALAPAAVTAPARAANPDATGQDSGVVKGGLY